MVCCLFKEIERMTTEEKLKKAIEFIESIEKLNKDSYDHFDISDLEKYAYGECDCCGDDVEVQLRLPSYLKNTLYIDAKAIDDLSDKAWHLLFDLKN